MFAVTVATSDSTFAKSGNVVGVTRRKPATFDKPNFDPHDCNCNTDEDDCRNYGQNYDFHRYLGFSDAKVAIKFKF